ncbi:hypothetical protein DX910_14500 [Acinetobacter haemolyticus]|nr:hypothetical protein DX910_14500 [Acinetobacter haemolyticus]
MNTQAQQIQHLEEAKNNFVRHDRARLVAELATERQKTTIAKTELVYSKRFYRLLVCILVALIVVMYGGLWYAKTALSSACI